jgi:hypothetical protein
MRRDNIDMIKKTINQEIEIRQLKDALEAKNQVARDKRKV